MSVLLEKLAWVQPPGGPDWLAAARRRARRQLMKYGFPTLKTEDWKYTSLRGLERAEFVAGMSEKNIPPFASEGGLGGMPSASEVNNSTRFARIPPAPLLKKGGVILEWLNGTLIVPNELPAGLRLTSFNELDEQRGRTLLTRDFGATEAAFAWLNTDQFSDGWLLEITETPEQPISLAFRTTEDYAAAEHPRLALRLAPDVHAQVIEWHEGSGAGLLNIVMTTQLDRGARLDYTRFQNHGPQAHLIERHDFDLARDCGLDWTAIDLGARLMRHDLNVNLNEPGSECRINGVFVARGRGVIDHHTRITHAVGQTQSRERFRGILADSGTGVFNGKIIMAPGADGSDSDLNTANLLLSPDARINAKPELEIHAEEVKASHGATVGALDESALFYLQSRGLPRDHAVSMLKQAFVAEILEQVSEETLRKAIGQQVQKVLES